MSYFPLVRVACQTVCFFYFPPTEVATCSPRLPIFWNFVSHESKFGRFAERGGQCIWVNLGLLCRLLRHRFRELARALTDYHGLRDFEVTHPIELHGIRLFGAKNSNYSVKLELINVENSGEKVWLEGLLLGKLWCRSVYCVCCLDS